ncbi:hypothetical protein OG871_09345 [Kitasatospora sp. NBC_00374]|uniref:hypothetical protein n=1 Tax=Kitasatospora sp. NBC_00374 TaxID=2975964 RepID=UPI00324C3DB4
MKRRTALALGAGTLLGGAGLWAATDVAGGGGREEQHTGTAVMERHFPALGPLVSARWVTSRDNERTLPSPDFVVTAVLRLQPGRAAALIAGGGFTDDHDGVSLSWFEKPLAGLQPPGAAWVRSEAFDATVTAEFEHGRCSLDPATDTAFLTAINPTA